MTKLEVLDEVFEILIKKASEEIENKKSMQSSGANYEPKY